MGDSQEDDERTVEGLASCSHQKIVSHPLSIEVQLGGCSNIGVRVESEQVDLVDWDIGGRCKLVNYFGRGSWRELFVGSKINEGLVVEN